MMVSNKEGYTTPKQGPNRRTRSQSKRIRKTAQSSKSIMGSQRYRERSFGKLPEMNLAEGCWFCIEKDERPDENS